MLSKLSLKDKFPPGLINVVRHPAFIAASVALLVMLYFVSDILHTKLITEPHDKTLQAAAKVIPSKVSKTLTAALKEHRQTLQKVATSAVLNTAMTSAPISDADSPAPTPEQALSVPTEIESLLPDARAIHISQNPRDFKDQSNFVALTLIDAALRGKAPPITTMKQDEWLVVMAEPIPGESTAPGDDNYSASKSPAPDNDTLGAILIEMPFSAFDTLFKDQDPSLGKLALIQKISGLGQQTLASAGGSGIGKEARASVTAVPGLSVTFKPSQKMIDQHHPDTGLFRLIRAGLWVMALLGIVATSVFVGRRVNVAHQPNPSDTDTEKKAPSKSQYLLKREAGTLVETSTDSPEDKEDDGKNAEEQPVAKQENDVKSADDGEVFDLNEASATGTSDWPPHIFRDYDIRGLAGKEINEDFANALGQTLGTQALDNDEDTIIVGRDGRLSSPALSEALIGGLLMSGCNVTDLGEVPSPVVNFVSQAASAKRAIIVTASHNPANYNGFKLLRSGASLHGSDIQMLRDDMLARHWRHGEGIRTLEISGEAYLDAICQNIETLSPLSVVVDCGNGVAGTLAPQLMQQLGCECTPLYCDVNGAFPNHQPDPTQEKNLEDLIQVVAQTESDLGLAFDGDGDRLVAVTSSGRIVWPDELMMIFARDIVARHPGSDIVFDVKSTRRLTTLISGYGGRPVMWKTGHSHIREKVAELKAPLGGEFSGHLFFNDRWHGFDDGLYAAARLLEVLSLREQSLDAVIQSFETSVSTAEIRIPISEADKFATMEKIVAAADFENAKINTLDGLRVDFEDSWGLVRASNTEAALTLRFEADDKTQLSAVQEQFKALLASVDPELEQALNSALA